MKAEDYIKEHELMATGCPTGTISTEAAYRAVEIARSEVNGKVCDWQDFRKQAALGAMQGLISNRQYMDYMARKVGENEGDLALLVAEDSVEFADALVKELQK